MTTWERVRFENDDDGRAHTVILRDPHETTFMNTPCLSGIEVDEENDELVPRGLTVDQRYRVIQLDLIIKRTPLKMNNHYGMLEDA